MIYVEILFLLFFFSPTVARLYEKQLEGDDEKKYMSLGERIFTQLSVSPNYVIVLLSMLVKNNNEK